jgi:phage-related protein
VDGYLKIKTKIDNKEIDKGIAELENKIKKLQSDNASANTTESNLQKEIDNYEELCQNADRYKQKIKELEVEREKLFKANPELAVSVDTPEYASINSQIAEMQSKYVQATKEIDKQAPQIDKVYQKLDKVKAKQTENNAKISEFKQKIESIKTNNIQNSLNNVGKNLQSQIGKLGKMAMAVVGIRTAWYAVRGAVNSVKQYNKQVATDFEYMRYVIANALVPVVQVLVKLLYTVLSYVNAIVSAWFGINLFSGASVKNFKKMQASAGSTAKSAKEIQKSLQGFDEMNVLSDNSDSSSGGGAGVSGPSMGLSGMQAEVPAWLQWIINNKELILGILAGIAAGILAIKFGLSGIKSLGIGAIVAGIVMLIQDIVNFIKDPSWQNFTKILTSIAIIIGGVMLVMGNWWGLLVIIVGLIVRLIIDNWDYIKEILGKVGQWIYDNVIMPVWNFIQKAIDWIVACFNSTLSVIEGIFTALLGILLAPFETLWEMVQGVFNGIKTIIKGIFTVFKGIFTGDMKTVLNGFKQIFKGVFDSLWSIAKAPLNLIIRGINALIRGANKIKFDVPDWVPGLGGKTFGFNIQQIPLLEKGTVVSTPTQAIIGEHGAEAVMPLENNLEWLDILADKLASRIGATGGSYIINMDGRTIQRGIARKQQQLAFAMNGR